MEALGDVHVLSALSPVHKKLEILDRYPDGRPHHVKATVKVLGLSDTEILEYHWGPDWVIYDAAETLQQRGQHIEYTVKPEGVDKSRVRFDVTVDPSGVPDFFVKRATKLVLDAATKGLCDWVSNRVPVRERED